MGRGGSARRGMNFFASAKKRNKEATLHLLDVLVTQHAKWTAKRIRRGLFGQALVDFSTPSWSSIQLKESAFCPASQQKREQPKKTPRLLRSFAQKRVVTEKTPGDEPLIPGMSPYSDEVDMYVGKNFSQKACRESAAS